MPKTSICNDDGLIFRRGPMVWAGQGRGGKGAGVTVNFSSAF